jgi:hypothetical protein
MRETILSFSGGGVCGYHSLPILGLSLVLRGNTSQNWTNGKLVVQPKKFVEYTINPQQRVRKSQKDLFQSCMSSEKEQRQASSTNHWPGIWQANLKPSQTRHPNWA